MPFALCKSGNCDYVTEDLTQKGCIKCGSPIVPKCPKCGTLISEKTAKFCSECNTRLKDEPEPKRIKNTMSW